MDLTKFRHKVFNAIHASGVAGKTVEEIAFDLGMTPQQVANPLSILSASNQVKNTGRARGNGLAGPAPVWIVERVVF